MTKAIGLFSGGLDSILAASLIREQGIDVELLIFASPFFNTLKDECFAAKSARDNGFKYRIIDLGLAYLDIIKSPKYGLGKNLNPCVDCKIMMLRIAREEMKKTGSDFVFTGEVLGQRPKSQQMYSLKDIRDDSNLDGYLLRPLSAKLMPESEPEKLGIVNREKLLDIHGRSRKRQIELSKKYGIKEYSTPAGGCLLTEGGYCKKLKDILDNGETDLNSILLLKVGRHFRYDKVKIIVGKNEEDNEKILELKSDSDIVLEVLDTGSPITIVRCSNPCEDVLNIAASLTARYADVKSYPVKVSVGSKFIIVDKEIDLEELEKIRI